MPHALREVDAVKVLSSSCVTNAPEAGMYLLASFHLVSAFVAPGVHPAAPVSRGTVVLAEGSASDLEVRGSGTGKRLAVEERDARCRCAHSPLRARATDVGVRSGWHACLEVSGTGTQAKKLLHVDCIATVWVLTP